jgi:hypothetical protein
MRQNLQQKTEILLKTIDFLINNCRPMDPLPKPEKYVLKPRNFRVECA